MIEIQHEKQYYLSLCLLDYLFSQNIIDKQDFINYCDSFEISNYTKIITRNEEAARSLNHEMHPGGIEMTLELASMAELSNGMMVLDAGCGHGGAARTLAEKYQNIFITGIDTDAIRVIDAIFRSKDPLYKNLKFLEENAYKTSFQDSYFDVVVRQQAVYGGQEEAFLSECKRILKQKGKIAFQGTFCNKKLKKKKMEMTDYSYEEYCNLLSCYGFRIIKAEFEKASAHLLSSIQECHSSYYLLVENGTIVGANIIAEKIN